MVQKQEKETNTGPSFGLNSYSPNLVRSRVFLEVTWLTHASPSKAKLPVAQRWPTARSKVKFYH